MSPWLRASLASILILASTAPAWADTWTDLSSGEKALEAWERPTGDWFCAAGVQQDSKKLKMLRAQPGHGILVNGQAGRTVDLVTKQKFKDIEFHVEFLIPKGSNSGVKLEGLYEIQILDSFGVKEPKGSDCGGIYPRAEEEPQYHHIDEGVLPRINAARPAGEWQTLDLIFQAPRFDAQNKKIANARFIKVALNGQVIHEDVEVRTPTGSAWRLKEEMPEGPLLLQGTHGPVAFRNVRVRPYAQSQNQSASPPSPARRQKTINQEFDVVIRGGSLYDGSGNPPGRADVGIKGDHIARIGDLSKATTKLIVNADNLAVAPGFINMLSWSTDSLIADGRGQSEIRQGVTTQIMGEGNSWGPVNAAIKKRMKAEQTDIKYDIEWNTLSDYLYFLQRKGISQNVASFLGATTVREYVLGLDNKKPTAEQLDQMRQLVEREMRGGALGIASALEYAPAYYADTEELIALCKAAAPYKGKYISHMRSEGIRLMEGIEEVIRISREAGIPAEIYHFKAAGKDNWHKMDAAIAKVQAARDQGLPITADMYCYTAGAASLTACIPPWAMEGGEIAMRRRLRDPDQRLRILEDIRNKTDWPNFYRNAGSPQNVLLISFKHETLKPLQGKTLAKIAKERNKDPVETLLDLLIEDESSIGTAYFITAEDNIRKLIGLPWISFGSDEAAQAPEGVFLRSMPHPRAYGNFARVLGKYVREEKLLSLESAIRKMTHLPATNLGLERRGLLKEDYFADIVVFDPNTIIDKATYEKPHQCAVGVKHVFVNGVQVLKDGEHTGAKPGRALWGLGKNDK